MAARFFLLFTVFIGFCAIGFACNSAAYDFQRRHPQQCVQCLELKAATTCDYGSLGNDLTCGEVRVNYYVYRNEKELCAKAVVQCSAKLPKSIDAVIFIEEPQNSTLISADVVEGSGEEVADIKMVHQIGEDVKPEPSYVTISKEEKFQTSASLTCNSNGKWEASELNGKKHEGVGMIHCVVSKVL